MGVRNVAIGLLVLVFILPTTLAMLSMQQPKVRHDALIPGSVSQGQKLRMDKNESLGRLKALFPNLGIPILNFFLELHQNKFSETVTSIKNLMTKLHGSDEDEQDMNLELVFHLNSATKYWNVIASFPAVLLLHISSQHDSSSLKAPPSQWFAMVHGRRKSEPRAVTC